MTRTSRMAQVLVISALAISGVPFTAYDGGLAQAASSNKSWNDLAKSWNDPDFPGIDPSQRAHYSCTFDLKRFRMKHQQVKYSAFARGRAFTITGMKGCGMSVGQRSQAIAGKLALKKCREVARNPDKCYVSDRTIEK